jgi:hypothetical protein
VSRSPDSQAFLRLSGSFGIFSQLIPTATAPRSGDPIPTEPSVAPSKGGPVARGLCAGFVCCITIGEFSRIPAALGFDWFFDFVRCAPAGTDSTWQCPGWGLCGKEALSIVRLTLSSGVHATVGIRARNAQAGAGGQQRQVGAAA